MSSAICFNLDQSQMFSSGIGLIKIESLCRNKLNVAEITGIGGLVYKNGRMSANVVTLE